MMNSAQNAELLEIADDMEKVLSRTRELLDESDQPDVDSDIPSLVGEPRFKRKANGRLNIYVELDEKAPLKVVIQDNDGDIELKPELSRRYDKHRQGADGVKNWRAPVELFTMAPDSNQWVSLGTFAIDVDHEPDQDKKQDGKTVADRVVVSISPNGVFYYDESEISQFTDQGGTRYRHEAMESKSPINTQNGTYGIHTELGARPPSRPDVPWLRIDINKGSHWGWGTRHLCPNLDHFEGWLAFDIRLTNWSRAAVDSCKLLGFAAPRTKGYRPPRGQNALAKLAYVSGIGGNGGGGSLRAPYGPGARFVGGKVKGGAGQSWSLRGFMSPGTKYLGQFGFEAYHSDSPNLKKDGRTFGQPLHWWPKKVGSNRYTHYLAEPGWHRVKIYLRGNDKGKNNGILRGWWDWDSRSKYVAFDKTDLHLSDNDLFRQIALYFCVWHGGSNVAHIDSVVEYANIRTWAGAEDRQLRAA